MARWGCQCTRAPHPPVLLDGAGMSTCPGSHTNMTTHIQVTHATTHTHRHPDPETHRAGHTDPHLLTQVLMDTPHLCSCTVVCREPWTPRHKDTHSHTLSQMPTQHTETISTHAHAQKDTQTCLHLDIHVSMNTHGHKSHTCSQAYTDIHTLKHRHKDTHADALTYAHTHSILINI